MEQAFKLLEEWRTTGPAVRAWALVSPDRRFPRATWGLSLFQDNGPPAMEKLVTRHDDSPLRAAQRAIWKAQAILNDRKRKEQKAKPEQQIGE